jgi:SAM-dependent methyltransferase
MRGLIETARKEWYWRSAGRRLARDEWRAQYWYDAEDARVVPCRRCPKFDAVKRICSVPFGTPLRKCVVGALESHLHATKGLKTLELGYGRRSFAKRIIELSGGIWTGVEPNAARDTEPRIGAGSYGHAASIPFPNETFDLVFGIQSLEHWEEEQPSIGRGTTYAACLREVWRVLKPAGSIYFDAPIRLHGHEMFVLADLPRIRRLFDDSLWTDVVMEKWRYDYAPLPKYPTLEKDVAYWRSDLKARVDERTASGELGDSVWLLAITAKKRPRTNGSV